MRKSMKTISHVDDVENDVAADFKISPSRIAIVAFDETRSRIAKPRRLARYVEDIVRLASKSRCDTVVFALSADESPTRRSLDAKGLFSAAPHLRTIVLEVEDQGGEPWIEVWRRGAPVHRFRQRLARSSEPKSSKQALMDGIPARLWGTTLYLACGESNIVSTRRGTRKLNDALGFMKRLNQIKPALILNPLHTYMTRPEMKTKRAIYSRAGAGSVLVSVWNRVKRKKRQAELPWQLFVSGHDRTELITPIGIPEAPHVRIGIIDLRAARSRR